MAFCLAPVDKAENITGEKLFGGAMNYLSAAGMTEAGIDNVIAKITK